MENPHPCEEGEEEAGSKVEEGCHSDGGIWVFVAALLLLSEYCPIQHLSSHLTLARQSCPPSLMRNKAGNKECMEE